MEKVHDLLLKIGDSLKKDEIEKTRFLLKDHLKGKLHSIDCIDFLKFLVFTLREKCLNTVFSGPNFPAFGLFLRFTKKISVFSPNTKKYGPEKTQYLDTFHVVVIYEKNDCLQIFMRNYP